MDAHSNHEVGALGICEAGALGIHEAGAVGNHATRPACS